MNRAPSLTSKRSALVLACSLLVAILLTTAFSAGNRQALAAQPTLPDIANAHPLRSHAPAEALSFAPGEMVVTLESSHALTDLPHALTGDHADLSSTMSRFGFTSSEQVAPGTYRLSGAPAALDVQAASRTLQSQSGVSYAGPNHMFHIMNAPNDEQYAAGQQWGVTQVKAEQAWDITTGSDSIVIAILDTGTAADHPDLEGKVIGGHDFINNDEDPYDDNGHGTYTAGIAAAQSNNGRGVVGMSWGSKVMPVKVLSARGSGSEAGIATGIRWAVDNGARIISSSLGGDIDSPVMRDAVQYAAEHNVLIVASSGNTPDGKPNYPAAYDSVLAVGATGRADTFTGFSSWGPYVDVTAPGVGILSTGWDNGSLDYEYANGTSASCPFVSGVAALVWSANPNLTAAQVKQIIEDSSDDFGDPGWDEHYGQGRLNAFRAVQMAQQGPPVPHTPTPPNQPTSTPPAVPTAPPSGVATISVNTTSVSPGALVSITGAGFGPNEIVDLSVTTPGGQPNGIGSAQTSGQGAFRAEVGLPKNVPAGKLVLSAVGGKSGLRASVDLNVSSGSGGNGGQSIVKGTAKAGPQGILVSIKPASGSGVEQTTQPGPDGAYDLSGLAAGMYMLHASSEGFLPWGPYTVQVDGTAADVKSVNITLSATKPAAFNPVPPNGADNKTVVHFAPVGHTLRGPFLKFWQSHGGLAIFGYPLSEEFPEVSQTDGKTYTVQYFERNRFEYHPEFANTPNEVLMGLLGVDSTHGRTFLPGAPFASDSTHAYFAQTQHSLSGPFLKYWQQHGGLAIFGYPISEELIENGYRVQYFERNGFEYHPEFANTPNEVLLGLLGVEAVKRNGWIAP